MRILHAFKVFPPDVWGGIPEVIAQLARGMAPRHQSSVLVARSRGLGKVYSWEDIPVEATGSLGTVFSTPLAPTFPFALARRAKDADVIVLHQPFPLNDFGDMLRASGDAALVLYWHSEIIGRETLVRWLSPLLKRTIERADKIVVSDHSLVTASPLLNAHADKCVTIPFGIDALYWSTLNEAQRQRVTEIREKYPRLLVTTGRLVPYKGFSVLIEALRQADVTAAIIGSGPLQSELQELARKRSITNVLLPGSLSRDDMKVLLHAARLYVLSSVSSAETFSVAQLEAMAVGLPIINTNLPTGVPHVARHGLEGLTVEPNNAQQLAEAINQLLSDPENAAKLGAAAQTRARTTYDLSKFISATEELYNTAGR